MDGGVPITVPKVVMDAFCRRNLRQNERAPPLLRPSVTRARVRRKALHVRVGKGPNPTFD
eukprot:scaffold180_cov311-Pinguiococcus_pyrenoidosus.AAC.13